LASPPLLTLAVVLLVSSAVFAQNDSSQPPVSWNFSSQSGAIVLHAHIKDGWRLYSTTMPDSLVNSRIVLDSSAKAIITGIEEHGRLQTAYDTVLSATTRFFTDDVEWVVHLRPAAGPSTGTASPGGPSTGTSSPGGPSTGPSSPGGPSTGPSSDLKGVINYMAEYGKDSIVTNGEQFRYGRTADGDLVAKSTALRSTGATLKLTTIDLANPINKCGGTGAEGSKGLLSIFILGFLGGLLGLIMPCTFPMIPLTVSFFTKRATSRSKGIANAFLYGFFIFLIYVLISVPFYFLKQSDSNILNTISTSVPLNIIFGAIFIVFALSFFGLFEITLPSRFSNSVDARSNITSVGGIFFMALTLAIVSFSCTGPILGSLLVGALNQTGGAVQLTVAMAGFGLALGLPFALFALFPQWLKSLPRSGNWMNTVKIVFGFIEIALAVKYLSNADLVVHKGLLKREVFVAVWLLIDIALVLFLFGIVRFHHDPPPARLSTGRKITGLFFIAVGLYLAPGVTNTEYAKLPLLSGIAPPWNYSIYHRDFHLINDFEKAVQLAKQEHKPILIDFTGWACSNCRHMEEQVWPKPAVQNLIQNDYVLVSLYVDDRQALPEDQQFEFTSSDGSKRAIRTIGDKFATMQTENFGSVSQPFYVLLSPDQRLLTRPVAYTPDPAAYAQWLQCGLDAFKTVSSSSAKN
jgi:thiol:disulfide interchange protein DsbD